MEAKEQPEKSVGIEDQPKNSEDKRDEKDTDQAELEPTEQTKQPDKHIASRVTGTGQDSKTPTNEQSAKADKENNDQQTKVTPMATVQGKKGPTSTKAPLPGPTWPLDSHPDRIKEYLRKWNMIDNKATPKTPTPQDRPKGWQDKVEFVAVAQQAPQKPRGRKPKKEPKESKGNGKDDEKEPGEKPKGGKGKGKGKEGEEAQQPAASTSKQDKSKRARGDNEQDKGSKRANKAESPTAEPQAKRAPKRKRGKDDNQDDKENKEEKENKEDKENIEPPQGARESKVEMSEDEKRKKLLSRKCVAYKAARKKALDQGLTKEEAAKAGRQVSCLS